MTESGRFGIAVRRWADTKQVPVKRLAHLAGFSVWNMHQILRGCRPVSLEEAASIARALEIPTYDLLRDVFI